ncbi:hypothetical protein MRX96_040473 [Rhipicephalus microplus]
MPRPTTFLLTRAIRVLRDHRLTEEIKACLDKFDESTSVVPSGLRRNRAFRCSRRFSAADAQEWRTLPARVVSVANESLQEYVGDKFDRPSSCTVSPQTLAYPLRSLWNKGLLSDERVATCLYPAAV